MKRYSVMAGGRLLEVEAFAANYAAKLATTEIGMETGDVFVSRENCDVWSRYAVLGRRYVVPMGRVGGELVGARRRLYTLADEMDERGLPGAAELIRDEADRLKDGGEQ